MYEIKINIYGYLFIIIIWFICLFILVVGQQLASQKC